MSIVDRIAEIRQALNLGDGQRVSPKNKFIHSFLYEHDDHRLISRENSLVNSNLEKIELPEKLPSDS